MRMLYETPLVPGRLQRRYKRFLADVRLDSGEEVVAHCANPGAMLGLAAPDARVWLEPNRARTAKLAWRWRLEEVGGALVGINASAANAIVATALAGEAIPELAGYTLVQPEVAYDVNSRVDFLLKDHALDPRPCYVEVKNAHLKRHDQAQFPDCVTARGAKHLHALAQVAQAGARAVLLYVVQRDDCTSFALADDLDPVYADAAQAAKAVGVEMLAYACAMDLTGAQVHRRLCIQDRHRV